MHQHKGVVTFGHVVQNDSYSIDIVNIPDIAALDIQFAVYAVNAFYPAENCGIFKAKLVQFFLYIANYTVYKGLGVDIAFDNVLYFVITDRVKNAQ